MTYNLWLINYKLKAPDPDMYVLNTYNFRYDMLHIICNIEIYRPEQGFTHQSQLAEDDKIQFGFQTLDRENNKTWNSQTKLGRVRGSRVASFQ